MIKTMTLPNLVWDCELKEMGKVIGTRHGFCKCCGKEQDKLVVRWRDGKKNHLCPAGLTYLSSKGWPSA